MREQSSPIGFGFKLHCKIQLPRNPLCYVESLCYVPRLSSGSLIAFLSLKGLEGKKSYPGLNSVICWIHEPPTLHRPFRRGAERWSKYLEGDFYFGKVENANGCQRCERLICGVVSSMWLC